MKGTYLPGILAVLLTLGSIGMAYPIFNTTSGIIVQPNAHTLDIGSFVFTADLLAHERHSVKARLLYGYYERVEAGASFAPNIMDKTSIAEICHFVHSLTNYQLTNDSSLAVAANLHGSVNVRYSLHY